MKSNGFKDSVKTKIENLFFMKKLIILFTVVLTLVSCNSKNTIRIGGELQNGEGKLVKLNVLNSDKGTLIDTIRLEAKQKFSFKFQSEEPNFYVLSVGNKVINLFAEPGEKINLNADYNKINDYSVVGSKGSEDIKQINIDLAEAQVQIDSLVQVYLTKNANSELEASKAGIDQAFSKVYIDHRKKLIRYIITNQNSLVSIYALYLKYKDGNYVLNDNSDINYIRLVAEKLSETYPDHPQTAMLLNDLNNINGTINNMMFKGIMTHTESHIPNIVLPDVKGDTISIYDYKGKYILLNFWASWSKKSVDFNPQLVKVYNKHKRKGFEVYAVALDSEKENWQKAINFDQLPWINVNDYSYPESYVAKIYNVNALPTNFLISPDMDIIGKNLSAKDLDRILVKELK